MAQKGRASAEHGCFHTTAQPACHKHRQQTLGSVKQQGGSVSRMITEVDVSCLPKHLPEYIDVDVG